ncbi:hypothetical protein [Cryptosporangium arvum]|uniref:Uncharacterized protein n=1 Tax=Cryptosporangium arvum DSM 44712 TaxID=927661 RepID=A0A010ZRL5_9ACTN|nr:hypothetical protein [Cryptosporangium arvum]EXG79857.1 hypothetical protein CryarDRAFT_0905 [Cryptosporangium arvum DSM 44712]
MSASGQDLGVQLYGLLVAAKNHLLEIAGQYGVALAALDASGYGASGAFSRPAELGGGFYGPVYQPLADLREELAQALTTTKENLGLTADALVLATQVYADSDAEAAAEFHRLLTDQAHGEPRPGDNGVVPPPGASGGRP